MNSHESHSITLAEQAWTACGRPLGSCGQRKKPRCPHSPTTSPPPPGREVIAKLQGPSGPDALRLPKQFSYKILEKYPTAFRAFGLPKSTNTKQKFDSDFRVEATNPFHSDFYLRQHGTMEEGYRGPATWSRRLASSGLCLPSTSSATSTGSSPTASI